MKQMNKKGAIEITATAIVVFIIAIVVLGAVIYFVQSFFPDVFSTVTTQLEQIKQTLRTQLKSGEKVAFDFGNELKIKSGDKKDIYFGIQNDLSNRNGDSICFKVALKCVKPFNVASQDCNGNLVGGESEPNGEDSKEWFKAKNLLSAWDIRNNDFDVQGPIPLQPRVTSDTYLMKAEVYKAEGDVNCAGASSFKPYYSKQFRLIVQ
jgi:hypothetical protein